MKVFVLHLTEKECRFSILTRFSQAGEDGNPGFKHRIIRSKVFAPSSMMSFVILTPTFNSTQPDEQAIEMDIELVTISLAGSSEPSPPLASLSCTQMMLLPLLLLSQP